MADDDLAAIVGSRLCHDLVSPLGAIGNGVELLSMIQGASDELTLVEDAVRVAQARVKLFRLAFGRAHEMQDIRASEIIEALTSLSSGGRLSVDTAAITQPLPRICAKRLTLAALCLENALAYGGEITVNPDRVTGNSPRLKIDPDLWEPLVAGQSPAEMRSDTVQFALLASTGPVTIEDGAEGLTIRV